MAAGKVLGKPCAQIAAETGLAPSTVYHQLADPRTITMAQRLKAKSAPQLERTWDKALNTLEADVLSIDPNVCATARAQFFRVVTLGDAPQMRIQAPHSSGGDFTLEELLISYRRVSVSG
jgi:hypothetical protein